MTPLTFSTPDSMIATRLDRALADRLMDFSRTRLQALIKDYQVAIDGKIVANPSLKISGSHLIQIHIPDASEDTPAAEKIPLEIMYEDSDLLVLNKAAGMVVHPGAGNHSGTLVHALLHHCKDSLSGIGGVKRPGIVHRLDKDTSGLMIVAKNDKAHHHLSEQLQSRTLSRVYSAYCWNVPLIIKGRVDLPIGRHRSNRLKMSIQKKSGRPAITDYMLIDSFAGIISKIECRLQTGRTHQIRVHMQQIKHPLIGDPLYGMPQQEMTSKLKKAGFEAQQIEKIIHFPRQALHAAQISFIHPATEEDMTFSAPMPDDCIDLENTIKTVS